MDADTDGSGGPDESGRRRKVHGMLKLYYGLDEEGKISEKSQSLDPCDINGPHFDPELYLNKVCQFPVNSIYKPSRIFLHIAEKQQNARNSDRFEVTFR